MSHSFRLLLPATTKQDRGPPVGSQQKRKIRAQACEACRLYKTKCSGERPTCAACLTRMATCRYVESEARQAKRKYEDLRKKQSTHEELLSLMRMLPEQDALDLFRRVRAGEDAGSILSYTRDGDLLLQMRLIPETRLSYELPYSRDFPARLLVSESPYLNSTIYEVASQRAPYSEISEVTATEPQRRILPGIDSLVYQSQYVKPYHAAAFVEPRLNAARPSEWTTVCKDDALLRDLLAAYFMHEYHLFPAFHKDYFLEDMATAQSDRRRMSCCSALLVNATLAYACCCYKKLPNRFKYWEPEGLGYRFLAEARRIWELQTINGRNRTLTSIQAALMINIVHNLFGLDKLGNLYGLQALAIAREMLLFDGNADDTCERVRHAKNFTAWCLFNTDSISYLNWQFFRPPFLSEAPKFRLPDPSVEATWYGEIWTRYPLSPTLSQAHFGHYFTAISHFRVILGELCHASFGKNSKLPAQQAMIFVRRLLEWFQTLPTVLKPMHIVLPAHFLMHLDYHIVLMTICQPFTHDQWDDRLEPRNIVLAAERDINVLLRLYYYRHGFVGADSWLTAPLAKIGFSSLHSINDQTSPEDLEYLRSSLFLALSGLREQGRNYYISKTVYHIIKNQVRPEEAGLLLGSEDPQSVADENPGLIGEVQSAWVPRIIDISDDPVAQELSDLAKQFLTLKDGGQDDDGSVHGSSLSA
ncbi:hypothetical protein BU25DRAFT_347202 [Macroventuria anomochaeta]|uniref:Uncharacterized protein n=1 Tax=Macroventuria anomochaeta TaxID=301207 RepID=A0ACB6RUC3_9PLEO|nr:uncharacterized protein BU25DRAFT_347202 [Macroventuria anomochaeta]KAF2624882.1 hypothetical protein BU25DRAFT_347202 [Macroventuria anomochaeta]